MIKPETHFYILTKKQYICEEMDNSKEKKKKEVSAHYKGMQTRFGYSLIRNLNR